MNKSIFNSKKPEDKYSCPCSSVGCCANPSIVNPEHECQAEDFCEDCFENYCLNCHQSCSCDL